MAFKAHRQLLRTCGPPVDEAAVASAVAATTGYNETGGNSYTASVYLALAALLESEDDLTGRSPGLFSYGSGRVAEFLAGRVRPGYRRHLRADAHREAVSGRRAVDHGSPPDHPAHRRRHRVRPRTPEETSAPRSRAA
ncbi:hydroxymethylglutaryl-CoA synthase [Streptomyces hainanensis]|uniref:Hydroxymethylglutaryl-coenzyme A synthase C-terminal domain-containing protein n=1 Tax=Streptomyces hainanensis TaxID=402648 RepID=A0A4R4T7R6_9ACTN|nr:hydroxymethylglutaryl-CoA synthase [Streptomyces hainanensis]TDC73047.1 hypothetical protein E1283_20135 [Streptomyces hainanensis]